MSRFHGPLAHHLTERQRQGLLASLEYFLTHNHPDFRCLGALGVTAIFFGTADREAVEALRALLRVPDSRVRSFAGVAIGYLYYDTGAAEALETLIANLADPDPEVFSRTCWGLAHAFFGSGSEAVFANLRKFFSDPNPEIRGGAVWALGHLFFGRCERTSFEAVRHLIDDPSQTVRTYALWTLSHAYFDSCDQSVGTEVASYLRHHDPILRRAAAEDLGYIYFSSKSSEAFDHLRQLKDDLDPLAQSGYLEAIGYVNFAVSEPGVVDLLAVGLDSPIWTTRQAAAFALGYAFFATGDRGVVTLLRSAAEDPVPSVRQHAITALGYVSLGHQMDDVYQIVHQHVSEVEVGLDPARMRAIVNIRDSALAYSVLSDHTGSLLSAITSSLYQTAFSQSVDDIGLIAALKAYNSGQKGEAYPLIPIAQSDPFSALVTFARLLVSRAVLTRHTNARETIGRLRSFLEIANSIAEKRIKLLDGLETLYRVWDKALEVRLPRDVVRLRSDLARAERATSAMPLLLKESALFRGLIEVAEHLSRAERVEHPPDKLTYLVSALDLLGQPQEVSITGMTAVDSIMLGNTVLGHLTRVVLAAANSYRQTPRLVARLLTHELFYADQNSAVLKLSNVGAALATNVTLTLVPNESFEVFGNESVTLASLPAQHEVDVEFNLRSVGGEMARLEFAVEYDDVAGFRRTLNFADVVSFRPLERPFTFIKNPYIPGTPIDPARGTALFYGRRDVLSFIAENVQGVGQRNIVVLYGPRRTGKTSILYQVREQQKKLNCVPIYVDISALVDVGTDQFLSGFCDATGEALKKTLDAPRPPTHSSLRRSPFRTFRTYLSQVESTLEGHRLLFLVDEYQALDEHVREGRVDRAIFPFLRSLMQHSQGSSFVFAGSRRIGELSNREFATVFSIALYKEIGHLERDDAIRLATEPVQGQLQYDDLAIEKMLTLTGRHPYFIQVVGSQLVDYANKVRKSWLTISDINANEDSCVERAEAHLRDMWHELTDMQKIALSTMAELEGRLFGRVPAELVLETLESRFPGGSAPRVYNALEALVANGFLERGMHQQGLPEVAYRFQIGLVRHFVQSRFPIAIIESQLTNGE